MNSGAKQSYVVHMDTAIFKDPHQMHRGEKSP